VLLVSKLCVSSSCCCGGSATQDSPRLLKTTAAGSSGLLQRLAAHVAGAFTVCSCYCCCIIGNGRPCAASVAQRSWRSAWLHYYWSRTLVRIHTGNSWQTMQPTRLLQTRLTSRCTPWCAPGAMTVRHLFRESMRCVATYSEAAERDQGSLCASGAPLRFCTGTSAEIAMQAVCLHPVV
jgi:hypothetical protein